MADPVDNVPVGIGAPRKIDAPIRSDRLPKTRTEVDTSNSGHHQGSRQYVGQTPVRSSTLTRTVARVGRTPFQHRDHYGGPADAASKVGRHPRAGCGVCCDAPRMTPSARGPQTPTGGVPMPWRSIRWVGLDVHARESYGCDLGRRESGELRTRRVVGRVRRAAGVAGASCPARRGWRMRRARPVMGWRARAGGGDRARGRAPGKTERPPADRVKTDQARRRSALRLLLAAAADAVTVPSVEEEQLRDLVRCREDIRGRSDARPPPAQEAPVAPRDLLGRHGEPWTRKHRSWLTSLQFADHASQATLADYLHAHDVLIARRDTSRRTHRARARRAVRARRSRGCGACAGSTRCPRWGCAPRSATGTASITPTSSDSYLGIVPSEHTTGAAAPAGSITKAGSTHARRLLVEAAYHYRTTRRSARRSSAASAANPRRSSTSPGARNDASTPAGASSKSAAQTQRDRRRRDRPRTRRLLLGDRYLGSSSRSGSAGIPAGGRPPHTASLQPRKQQEDPHHSQETHQLTLTPPRKQPVAAGEAARASRLAHNNSAICRLSNAPPGGAALDFRRRTCDEPRSWGTQPPNMSMTTVANPADARTAPPAATTSTTTTNQTMAINPYPLTSAPPYGRHCNRAGPARALRSAPSNLP